MKKISFSIEFGVIFSVMAVFVSAVNILIRILGELELGFAIIFLCITVLVLIANAVMYVIYKRNKKGNEALKTDNED